MYFDMYGLYTPKHQATGLTRGMIGLTNLLGFFGNVFLNFYHFVMSSYSYNQRRSNITMFCDEDRPA